MKFLYFLACLLCILGCVLTNTTDDEMMEALEEFMEEGCDKEDSSCPHWSKLCNLLTCLKSSNFKTEALPLFQTDQRISDPQKDVKNVPNKFSATITPPGQKVSAQSKTDVRKNAKEVSTIKRPTQVAPIIRGNTKQTPNQLKPNSRPLSGRPLIGRPLSGRPLIGKPLSGRPLTKKPLSGRPLSGRPLSGKPLSGRPLSNKPLSGRPLSGKPLSGRPLSGRPLSGRPLSGRPLSGRPLSGKPLSGRPLSGKPLSGRPLTKRPLSGRPLSGSPLIGKPLNAKMLSGRPTSGKPLSKRPVIGQPLNGRPLSGSPLSGKPVSGKPLKGKPVSGRPLSSTPISGKSLSGTLSNVKPFTLNEKPLSRNLVSPIISPRSKTLIDHPPVFIGSEIDGTKLEPNVITESIQQPEETETIVTELPQTETGETQTETEQIGTEQVITEEIETEQTGTEETGTEQKYTKQTETEYIVTDTTGIELDETVLPNKMQLMDEFNKILMMSEEDFNRLTPAQIISACTNVKNILV